MTAEISDADAALLIFEAEPKLRRWTLYSAQGFALYSAANDALRERRDPSGDVAQLASLYREDAVMMTAVRIYSLFDRQAPISFQVVKRHLAKPTIQDLMVNHYVGHHSALGASLEAECRVAIKRFLEAYKGIDIDAFKRLHHFRNIGLAHIARDELTKSITYDELGSLVNLAVDLSQQLTALVHGRMTYDREGMREITHRVLHYWKDAIARGIE